MVLEVEKKPQPKWMTWIGRVLSALPALGLLMSATMKFTSGPEMVAQFTEHFGYPASTLVPIAVAELLCTVIYLIPQTAVLGAVLLTGYLGGAVATHVRAGEPAFVGAVIFGVLVWAGLFFRDERVRALLPRRRP